MAEDDNPYAELFEQYLKDLRWAYGAAKERHENLVRLYIDEQGLDEETARARVRKSDGPIAHHPYMIYVLRKYWLEVDRMRIEREAKREWAIEPPTFLAEDLADKDEFELFECIGELAYWPIGLNEKGEWC